MSNSQGDASALEERSPFTKSTAANDEGPRKRHISLIHTWWPVAVGSCIIALESTLWGGADHTSGPLRRLYEIFFGPISIDRWEHIHHYIRKSGHFVGYGLLCLAWLRAWRLTFPGFRFFKDAALAVFGTAMIASADEFHQYFLPNRSSSPLDVLLDCCGAITMTFLTWLVLRWIRPKSCIRKA